MNLSKHTANNIYHVMLSLGPQAFLRLLLSNLCSVNHYYILGKNLSAPQEFSFSIPPQKSVAPITDDDIRYIKDSLHTLTPEDRRELLSRIIFYDNGFTNGYVIKNGDDIAYIQWLILPAENQLISRNYPGRFNPLTSRQIMIENAYTFPRYRGRGYFQYGTQQLLEVAKNNGYSSALCYIRKDRIVPLNETTQMGFRITKMVREYKLLGKVWRAL